MSQCECSSEEISEETLCGFLCKQTDQCGLNANKMLVNIPDTIGIPSVESSGHTGKKKMSSINVIIIRGKSLFLENAIVKFLKTNHPAP